MSMGGKTHWLLVFEDSINLSWNYFLKEKSELMEKVSMSGIPVVMMLVNMKLSKSYAKKKERALSMNAAHPVCCKKMV